MLLVHEGVPTWGWTNPLVPASPSPAGGGLSSCPHAQDGQPVKENHVTGTTQALRLTSPSQLLATIPYLLGFHPTDSLVVICLRETRLGLLAPKGSEANN